MSAYVVALIDIRDPTEYEAYAAAFDFESFSTAHGGEILMVSDEPEVLEGEWDGRLVVLKFPSRRQAHAWYESDEYREVRKIRWAHASSNLAVHLGVDEESLAAAVES